MTGRRLERLLNKILGLRFTVHGLQLRNGYKKNDNGEQTKNTLDNC